MDNFEGFETSVEEVSANVEIAKELELGTGSEWMRWVTLLARGTNSSMGVEQRDSQTGILEARNEK